MQNQVALAGSIQYSSSGLFDSKYGYIHTDGRLSWRIYKDTNLRYGSAGARKGEDRHHVSVSNRPGERRSSPPP